MSDRLSEREKTIAALIARGLANKEICRDLGVMEGTVKIHLHNIYGKLGLRNRTELAIVYQNLIGRIAPIAPSPEGAEEPVGT